MVLAAKIEKNAEIRTKHLGYDAKPAELYINSLGYQALGGKHYTQAERYFKMNIGYYPKSSNAYDSYGDLLLAKGDKANAILNFQKTLAIVERADTRQKLNELLGIQSTKLSAAALQQYVTTLDVNGMTVSTKVKNDALWMMVPGQPEFELASIKEHEFKIKAMSGYTIRFEMAAGKVVGAWSIQPDGTFKATVKQ
jgi:tetratricopeptide (TPR) repeat protein